MLTRFLVSPYDSVIRLRHRRARATHADRPYHAATKQAAPVVLLLSYAQGGNCLLPVVPWVFYTAAMGELLIVLHLHTEPRCSKD